jgi:hypothetical protein
MEAVQQALSGGDRRSLGRTEEVVGWVLADGSRLGELFACLFVDDEIVRMRASDALEKVCRQQPHWFVPYTERLLREVAAIDQPSVQWHLAQMLGEIPLNAADTASAISLLRRTLDRYQDWIVINLSLETLAKFARDNHLLREDFLAILQRHAHSRHKSVVARVGKLLKAFAR